MTAPTLFTSTSIPPRSAAAAIEVIGAVGLRQIGGHERHFPRLLQRREIGPAAARSGDTWAPASTSAWVIASPMPCTNGFAMDKTRQQCTSALARQNRENAANEDGERLHEVTEELLSGRLGDFAVVGDQSWSEMM